MSCLSCLLCCASTFCCKDKITRKLAFYPPKPPSYSLKKSGETLSLLARDQFGDQINPLEASWVKQEVVVLQTQKRQRIPAVHFKNLHGFFTIIFSHGNSTDIGLMRNYIADLSIQLNASILLYEYTGYGMSTGKTSEQNLNADIEAAYAYLIRDGVPWSQVILYGQSIGSSPTCHLASRYPVGGVILHSPLASGLFLVLKKEKKRRFDIFANIDKIQYIRCPVFLIHGTNDKQLSIRHSEWLGEKVHFAWPPWWVKGAGHNDIEVLFRKEYLDKIKEYLYNCQALITSAPNNDELGLMLKPFNLNISPDRLPACILSWPN